jgi:hypothetical protein
LADRALQILKNTKSDPKFALKSYQVPLSSLQSHSLRPGLVAPLWANIQPFNHDFCVVDLPSEMDNDRDQPRLNLSVSHLLQGTTHHPLNALAYWQLLETCFTSATVVISLHLHMVWLILVANNRLIH